MTNNGPHDYMRVGSIIEQGHFLVSIKNLDEFVVLGETMRFVRERYFDDENEITLSDQAREQVSDVLDDALKIAEALELHSLRTFLIYTKDDPPESWEAFDVVTRTIFSSFENELVFAIPSDRKHYFVGDGLFWFDLQSELPELASDMFDAAQAIGFGLPTGCVFYLMRVMEAAVAELATSLGIQNVDKEWGKILSDIDNKIKDMPKDDTRKKWNELRSNLWHVKECWRNDTMHPRRNYTQEQGADIYKAVQSFLKHMTTFLESKP